MKNSDLTEQCVQDSLKQEVIARLFVEETQYKRLPAHIAVIMDGNGRWAAQRGKKRSEGHRAGAEAARAIVTECRKIGIRHLTMYTFSKENWKRPKEEISFLFDLLVAFLREELPRLMQQGIRLVLLGEIEDIPFAARAALKHALAKTAGNDSMFLNLALNYSGREEIARAFRLIAQDGISPDRITPELISQYLYTAGQPDPDLLIRTSGEMRLSNYLLYQAAYSEFYFTEVHWPDFTPQELHKALSAYNRRERRFGKTAAQLHANTDFPDAQHEPNA